MLNKKLLISAFLLCSCVAPAFSQELKLTDLTLPKPPAYRVGLTSSPEQQFIQAIEEVTKPNIQYALNDKDKDANIADLTYADLSIKRISKEISQELQYEEKTMVADLSLLWQGAATQSDTINFALYKLANPDADKPDEKSIKKVLTTIASMSTLVGAGVGSPVIAGSSLIGGNILSIMGQDTKALNYKYTKVTDADMIILIRKVEDLQQKAVDLYYDYMCAKRQLEFMNDLVADRKRKFELAQKNNAARELIVITDAYYRTAVEKQRSAKADFFSKRAALEQFVGNETFVQFENELMAREGGDPKAISSSTPMPETDENDYNNTVQAVEQYTNNIPKENIEAQDIEVSNEIFNSETDNFYTNFQTGFAAPTTLEEFFNPELTKKPKKEKEVKQKKEKIEKEKPAKIEKLKKEKPQKVKKDNPKKEEKQKIKKVKTKQTEKEVEKTPVQPETSSWYETWNNEIKEEKLQEKQAKKDAKNKIKKQKGNVKKAKKDKLKENKDLNSEEISQDITNEGSEITKDEQINLEEKEKPVKIKKEKKVKEKKVKEKKPKKVKDPYPELHGQKPIHTYPRNSEKDLIFLHGRDKHEAKKPSQMTEEEKKELKIRNEEYIRQARINRRAKQSKELLDEASLKPVESQKARPVRMAPTYQQGQPYLRYDDNYYEQGEQQTNSGDFSIINKKKKSAPQNSKPIQAESAKQSQPTVVTTPQPSVQPASIRTNTVNSSGLLPLDDIKVPDLSKGGYSIHSY